MTVATISCSVIDGESRQPFALVDVGNPDWWKCPRCGSLDVNSIWRNCKLWGFQCVSWQNRSKQPRSTCRYIWHYQAITIERKTPA